MRLRSILRSMLVLGVLGFLVYSAVSASIEYFKITEIVDLSVQESIKQGANAGRVSRERVDEIRNGIVLRASYQGVAIDDRRLTVYQSDGRLRVSLKWTHALLATDRDVILAFPLSVDRTFDVAR